MRQDDRPLTRDLINHFLTLNRISKIRGHYEAVKPAEDGRIRTNLAIGGTYTGRFSSSEYFLEPSTNLQNLPKQQAKHDPLFQIREVLGPTPGRMLGSTDFSSAERRLLAYLADESRAIEWTEKGDEELGDSSYPYKKFGEHFFEDIGEWREISGARYAVCKMIVLALDRGVGWKTLKDQVNKDADLTGAAISASQAKDAVNLFHDLFPGYKRYFRRIRTQIEDEGYVTNCMGRKLILFDRLDSSSQVDSVVRSAVSFQAQAVGDIINARLRKMYEEGLDLVLQVHDEVLFECDPTEWKQVARLVKDIMEEPVDLGRTVPSSSHDTLVIPADVEMSMDSWAETEEVSV